MKHKYTFTSEMWLYPGMSGNWHFISLPKKYGAEIKQKLGTHARGWGSLRVEAKIGKTIWKTSIFPDKRQGTYILPIKADVRKREGIYAGEQVALTLMLLV